MAAVTPTTVSIENAGSTTLYVATFATVSTDTWGSNIASPIAAWAVPTSGGCGVEFAAGGTISMCNMVASKTRLYVLAQA